MWNKFRKDTWSFDVAYMRIVKVMTAQMSSMAAVFVAIASSIEALMGWGDDHAADQRSAKWVLV